MASTPSSLSEQQVFEALKATILVPPQVDQMVSWSHEKTLSAYTEFFVAVAGQGSRLSAGALAGASRSLWGLPPHDAKALGVCFAATIAWSRRRFKRCVSPASLQNPEQLVHQAFARLEGTPGPGASSPSSGSMGPGASSPSSGSLGSGGMGWWSDPQAIAGMYGLSPPPPQVPKAAGLVDLLSQETVESSQASAVEAAGPGTPPAAEEAGPLVSWTDVNTMTLFMLDGQGGKSSYPLVPGPAGFMVCTINGKVHTSEVPNLLAGAKRAEPSHQPRKRPACKRTRRRTKQPEQVDEPGLAEKVEEEDKEEKGEEEEEEKEEKEQAGLSFEEGEEEVEVVPEAAPAKTKKYHAMFYSRDGSYGIRQCFAPKRQVCSIRQKGASKAELMSLAARLIGLLESGEVPEAGAWAWVRAALKGL